MVRTNFCTLSWGILTLISSTPIAAVSFLSFSLVPTHVQGKEKGTILYSDRLSEQIPIENTSAWQLLDYLTVISLPPSIHSNHWLHFSIYFTINASGLTEQSSDESMAQSISLAPQVLVKVHMSRWARMCLEVHAQQNAFQRIFRSGFSCVWCDRDYQSRPTWQKELRRQTNFEKWTSRKSKPDSLCEASRYKVG